MIIGLYDFSSGTVVPLLSKRQGLLETWYTSSCTPTASLSLAVQVPEGVHADLVVKPSGKS